MTTAEATLLERARRMHRQLVLLQCLFELPREVDDAGWIATGDKTRDAALCAAIRDILVELAEHARALTTVPSPLNEWRPGDDAGDDRWRTLTEIERRDVLSLMASYENMVAWGEGFTRWISESEGRGQAGGATGIRLAVKAPAQVTDAVEFLKIERSRLNRLRHEMGFLERRRTASDP